MTRAWARARCSLPQYATHGSNPGPACSTPSRAPDEQAGTRQVALCALTRASLALEQASLAPRGVYVCGNTSSSSGLTVTVVKDAITGLQPRVPSLQPRISSLQPHVYVSGLTVTVVKDAITGDCALHLLRLYLRPASYTYHLTTLPPNPNPNPKPPTLTLTLTLTQPLPPQATTRSRRARWSWEIKASAASTSSTRWTQRSTRPLYLL